MKHSLPHHKWVLSNIQSSINMIEDEIERLHARIKQREESLDVWKADLALLETQIAEAEKQGKTGFDARTFCRTRKIQGDAQ